jgi:hypothetical protein
MRPDENEHSPRLSEISQLHIYMLSLCYTSRHVSHKDYSASHMRHDGPEIRRKKFAPICTAESVYIRKCSTLNGCFVCLCRTDHSIFLHFIHIYIRTYMFTNKVT